MKALLVVVLFLVALAPGPAISGSPVESPDADIAYTCPGPGDSCPLSFTCCLNRYLKTGQPEKTSYRYKCCGHANAVCCADFISCCPDGSICHVELDACVYPNNGTHVGRSRF